MSVRLPVLIAALLLYTLCLHAQQNTSGWYAFKPQENFTGSVVDMAHWLDAPAGKHGFVQINKEKFVFEDGTPIKFWGVNIASRWPFVANKEAKQWAQYLAKYGVNSVRFHKFTAPGITGNVSTQLDADKFKNLDYFSNELRERGIYYGWSHIYGHKPKPGDKDKLLAYEEVANAGGEHLKGSTIGLVNFAPDLQELSIRLTVNMLNHRNPYTRLRYADDPALSFIELQNEDNIFFATTHNWVMACPTYKKLFCEQFSDWLKLRYGSQQNLVVAWGKNAIDAWPQFQKGEHLDKRNIYPLAHHGYLSRKNMQNSAWRQRLLDTALFLYETQNAFYEKYIAAIRKTGYKGPVVASCWQAGDDVAHYYNLHSDYLAGIIDRHNYYGGGEGGHRLASGKVKSDPMLSKPGSGLLSTGMQAVLDRPFAFSEWMSMSPNEWIAESAPIIAVYGMGLQGWDASYVYASNQAHFTPVVQAPRHGVYNADTPWHLGLYPALARMVYRNDVQEGEVVAARKVHVPSLQKGEIGFTAEVKQEHDVKSFGGDVPEALLAAGKVVVSFTDEPEQTQKVSLVSLADTVQKIIPANTGQLHWYYKDKGYFTVNTPGTKAVVGFAGKQPHRLDEVVVTTSTPFAVIFITSLEKAKPIAQAKHILVTTLARAQNTGMHYSADRKELLEVGEAPIVMEPVQATLSINHSGTPTVYVLDHAGRRTGEVVKATGKNIELDGKKYQTLYYELEYK